MHRVGAGGSDDDDNNNNSSSNNNGDPLIAVAGARGFVAGNLRKRLSGNHRLVGLSRKKFAPLKNERAVSADYADPERLGSDLGGCDVLVHLVGVGDLQQRRQRQRRHRYTAAAAAGPGGGNDVNTDVTAALVAAARTAKVRQIIFLSGLGVSPVATASAYFASKLRAERIIRDSGIGFTIFRPSFIVGKNDYLTKSLNRQIAKTGRVAVPGGGGYRIQPVRVSDAVEIIADSVLNPRFMNRTFDLVGPDTISFKRYAESFCRGRPAKASSVPLEECLYAALHDRRPVYGLDDLCILCGSYTGDFDGLRRAFGRPVGSVLGGPPGR